MTKLLNPFHLFIGTVTVVGLGLLAWTLGTMTPDVVSDAPLLLWALAATVIIAELLPINVILRGQEGELMTSTSFAFATLIAFGPAAAIPALCLGSVVGDIVRRKRATRVLFNAAQYAIALSIAGFVQAGISDVPRAPLASFTGADLPVVLLVGVVFFAVNTVLVGTVIALASGYRVWGYVASDFLMQTSTAGFALGLAPVMVIIGEFSVGMLPLLALPIIAIHRNTRQAVVNEHQALHDSLTGLPNRVLFHDRVEQAIESGRRHETGAVVMVMDLDHFKEINDTLGHYHGDLLLQLVGERLTDVLRAEDTVARLGGDEFAVLLPSVRDQSLALTVAGKILEALRAPFDIDGLSLEVGASIGIACFPAHGDDKETLIQRADIAMYVAKGNRTGAQLYESEQDRHSVKRLALAGELRRAIQDDELVLHYQPKIDVASGQVVGAEALARWQHPSMGLIMPDEFVPLAEHTGLITPMTRHVISLALQQVAHWRAQGHRMSVAVNLCARSFLDQQLLDDIAELLSTWRVDAALLELEITESMIVGDPDRVRIVLDQLSELGVTVAIDDFGTGYSSLAYLRELPVDEIKIDKSFVLQMGTSTSDETIVRSIIDLAHNLDLIAVAEGVEDQRVLARLGQLGCDVVQGYHFSRPLPADQFARWMEAYPGRALWLPGVGTSAVA